MIITPISRTQERIVFDNGANALRCYGPHNPHYYSDQKTGLYLPIDFGEVDLGAKSKIGNIIKKNQNIRSFGVRNDLNSTKLFGIRPDWDQTGEVQFEVSPVSLKINDINGSLSASKSDITSSISFDFGNFNIFHNRHFTRFCIKGDSNLESFELKLRFDLTGLDPIYNKDLDEYWFYTKEDEFFARIRKPLLLDPETLNDLNTTQSDLQKLNLLGHDLQQMGDGSWIYTKYSKDDLRKIGVDSYLIDGDIYYSTTADGITVTSCATGLGWAFIHDAAAAVGGVYTNIGDWTSAFQANWYNAEYHITRSFFYFDTTGAGEISICNLKLCDDWGYNGSGVVAQKGAQADILTLDDYSAFSGSEYGHTDSWTSNGVYNTISFNATGIADINLLGTTKVCCREYTKDYLDVTPVDNVPRNGVFFADTAGTTYDPYLDITKVVSYIDNRINPLLYRQTRGRK